MGNHNRRHMMSYDNYALQPMTDQQFQDTYGEVPVLRGEFDVDQTAKLMVLGPALSSCIWCPFVAVGGLCCYSAIKKSVASRKLTLGERSLFYAQSTYLCCGPCQCLCSSSEKQVPLDKLQYTGLKNPRDFKQVVLEKRNQVVGGAPVAHTTAPGLANDPDCSSILLRIEQRLLDIEQGCRSKKNGFTDAVADDQF